MLKVFKQHFPHVLPALVLALLGVAAAIVAADYGIGSFTRMGPGFMPLMLGIVLILLAAFIAWQEMRLRETWSAPAWRPFIAITLGILAWVALVENAGFFPASVCQVILTSLALPSPRWRNILILAGTLSIAGYLLFVVQLGVPLEAVG